MDKNILKFSTKFLISYSFPSYKMSIIIVTIFFYKHLKLNFYQNHKNYKLQVFCSKNSIKSFVFKAKV